MITIDLHHANDFPSGRYVTQFKTTKQDKMLIDQAATSLGLSLAAFIRNCALQAARQTLEGNRDRET